MFPVLNFVLAQVRIVFFDFDGVFTDNIVHVSQEGVESVSCWRSDGLGLERLRSLSVEICIVSTERNPVVTKRATKLGVECVQGVENKADAIRKICNVKGIDLKRAAFLGNDINDISAFEIVGLPVAVADAYPEIFPYVMAKTSAQGGRGAVREFCDAIYFARKDNISAIDFVPS